MGYEELWKALADLLTELRRKSENIPTEIMNNLRSAKTMIQILKVDPSHTENLLKVEMYLGNLEPRLLRMAQDKIAPQGIEQWMKKFEKARGNVYEKKRVVDSKFVQGLPRSEQWIRIQISEDRPQEDIERMADENELSYRMQENGYMLVYGNSENLKSYIKKIRKKSKEL
jgi:hypothetical protein